MSTRGFATFAVSLCLFGCAERERVPETTATFGGSGAPAYSAAASSASAPATRSTSKAAQPPEQTTRDQTQAPGSAAAGRSTDPKLPRHSAGPPRHATPQQIAVTRRRAERLTASLLKGGIARREVTSVADIHGSTLYMKRRYAQALTWYQVGLRIDASFEPILYNAARAAALLGKQRLARRYLAKLRELGTPLGRRRLARARRDPDLSSLR